MANKRAKMQGNAKIDVIAQPKVQKYALQLREGQQTGKNPEKH